MELAGDYWLSAQDAILQHDLRQALDRFVRSLESLETYWGEINFWKTPAGETIALDRACLDGISGIVNGLNLIGQSTKITLEFQQRYTGTASCQAVYDGNAIAGIPIEWTASLAPKRANCRLRG